jgi:hypothetical protein
MLKPLVLFGAIAFALHVDAGSRAMSVRIEQLVREPQRFNGKRVSFVGVWDVEHHGAFFRSGITRIACDFDRLRLPKKQVEAVPHPTFVRVTGVFRYVDMTPHTRPDGVEVIAMGFGWMNSCDREIAEISEFTPVRR